MPPSFASHLVEWESFLAAVEENREDFAFMEARCDKLRALLEQVTVARQEQLEHRAQAQKRTVEILQGLEEGRKLLTLLRFTAREVYGSRSPKLLEFGRKTLRRLPRRGEAEAPAEPEDREGPGGAGSL
jgi:hypothetical protein